MPCRALACLQNVGAEMAQRNFYQSSRHHNTAGGGKASGVTALTRLAGECTSFCFHVQVHHALLAEHEASLQRKGSGPVLPRNGAELSARSSCAAIQSYSRSMRR